MNTYHRILLTACTIILLLAHHAAAQTPGLVSYQGRVAVGTVNFDGTGQFRFAIVNANGNTVYWGNSADTAPADGVPDTAVSLTVAKGLYSVLLGDTSIANMAAIPTSVWANGDIRLRVWFNDGVNSNQLLTPDQRLAPNGYLAAGVVTTAQLIDSAITSGKINDGAVTSAKLNDGAVSTTKLANNAVTSVQLANSAVTTPQIADNAVTTSKLNDSSVTTAKINGQAIGTNQLAGNAVTGPKIADGSITSAKLTNGAVQTANLVNSAVNTAQIADDAISNAKIANGAVGSLKLGDAAVTAAKLGADVGLWSVTGADVYRSASNVGIGAAAPLVSLTHPNSLLPGNTIYDATTHGLHVDGGDKGIVAIEGDNRATLHLRSDNASDDFREFVIRHDSTGHVTFAYPFGYGINEAPVMKMLPYEINMFQNNLGGCTLRVGDNSGGTASVSVRNSLSVDEGQQTPSGGVNGVKFGGSTSGELITSNRTAGSANQYGLDLYTASQVRLSIASNGNVGIGTDPGTLAKLTVGSVGTAAGAFTTGRYMDRTSTGASNGTWNGGNVSIQALDNIVCVGIYATSDERTKNILGFSDAATDLNTLRNIKITDYRYKDDIANGQREHKKVVAQQVEKVFPQAVSRATGVVPDIFRTAVVEDGWIQVATDLKKGDRVRLIGEKDETSLHEVLAVRGDAFLTDYRPATGKVFVYGREVADFRRVDYDAIAMLNVSATQELARKLDAKDQEMKTLREENAALKKQMAESAAEIQQLTATQATRDQVLEARIARLEQAAPATTPSTASAATPAAAVVKVALKK